MTVLRLFVHVCLRGKICPIDAVTVGIRHREDRLQLLFDDILNLLLPLRKKRKTTTKI